MGEFTYHGQRLFVVGNHFTSRLGSSALFGRPQPPEEGGKAKRLAQAEVVAGFVTELLTADPNALVVVLGDLNDFQFSAPVDTLEAAGLTDLFAHAAGGGALQLRLPGQLPDAGPHARERCVASGARARELRRRPCQCRVR